MILSSNKSVSFRLIFRVSFQFIDAVFVTVWGSDLRRQINYHINFHWAIYNTKLSKLNKLAHPPVKISIFTFKIKNLNSCVYVSNFYFNFLDYVDSHFQYITKFIKWIITTYRRNITFYGTVKRNWN